VLYEPIPLHNTTDEHWVNQKPEKDMYNILWNCLVIFLYFKMIWQNCKPVLLKYVSFADGGSIYPYWYELQSNGGFGSGTAGLSHSHSDQPVIMRYATSTGS
jgi:hypothetical protein